MKLCSILILFAIFPKTLLAEGLAERLKQLETRLTLLERQIIASPTSCDTLGSGWSRFEGAKGRFLMGDNGDTNFGETGGAKSVTLSVPNLAPHNHEVTNLIRAYDEGGENTDGFQPGGAFDDGGNPGRAVALGTPQPEHFKVVTKTQGSSTPISVLPPFLEIHFCTKLE